MPEVTTYPTMKIHDRTAPATLATTPTTTPAMTTPVATIGKKKSALKKKI